VVLVCLFAAVLVCAPMVLVCRLQYFESAIRS
jgi:hypothetical protein